MPDWEKLLRQRLPDLGIAPEEQREIFAELAGHLEEAYETLRRQGVPKEEAARRTLSQITDWNDLRQQIHLARRKEENIMNTRVTRFWLPGLITLTLSSVLLAANQILGPRPTVLHAARLPLIILFIPWLVGLPLVGAIGSYLSRRAGATMGIMVVSSVFPVLPFAGAFLIILPVALLLDHRIPHNITITGFLTGWFMWILLPAAALVVGGVFGALLPSPRPARNVTGE